LGFALFVRQPRGVALTAAGETFAARARSLLLELDNAVVQARRVAQGHIGTVRVALTSSAAFHPLTPTAIRNFRDLYPEVAIEMTEVNAADIIEMMIEDRADAAILRKPVHTPAGLRFELLAEERMLLVLPVGHRLISSRAIALQKLANESFIFVRRPGAPGMYADFISACQSKGFEPHVVDEVPRMVTAINLVAAGGGISLVPASMHRYHQESVRYCRVAGDHAFRAPLHLVTRDDSQSPAASHFRQALLAFVHQHPSRE
jgi:DNA-binding transcriptional LysR family regulator